MKTYLYILGSGRSGTTLLDWTLDSHPEILGLGEVSRLPECLLTGVEVPEFCACGRLLLECSFWMPIIEMAKKQGKVSFDEWNTELLKKLLNFKKGTKVVLDSSCEPERLRLLLESSIAKDYSIKVIYMSRDVRGVVYSSTARGFGDKGVRHSLLRSAVSWRLRNTRALALLKKLPKEDYLHITYEGFTNNTDSVLRQIQDFVGVKSLGLISEWKALEHHTFCGNVRLRNSKETNIIEDIEWKTALSTWQKLIISLVSGALNRRVNSNAAFRAINLPSPYKVFLKKRENRKQNMPSPIDKYIYFARLKLRALIHGLSPAALRGRSTAPKVLINSIPKAGTHLLESALDNFPMLRNGARRTLRGWDYLDKQTLANLKALRRGQFITAHLPAHKELLEFIEASDIKMLLMVRDPRDIAVSKMKYLTEVNLAHPLHDYFASLPNDDERLLSAINGLTGREASIGEVFRKFEGWIGRKNILMVRFEDLIGEEGGGTSSAQLRCIKEIAAHLELDLSGDDIANIAKDTFSTKSQTFRKGTLGGWRSQFKGIHMDAFERSRKLISKDFGYDDVLKVSSQESPEAIKKEHYRDGEKKSLPNFVIIGTSKAGTTSMYYYLRQHPDIYLPGAKELHYFTFDEVSKSCGGPGDREIVSALCRDRDTYLAHYASVTSEHAVGEISPTYFYFSDVSERLRSELGDVKIIIMLRNPIEKAFSQYMHLVRENREELSFYDALMCEDERAASGWGDMWRYAESALYSDRVAKYIEVFGRENVHVVLFDDFKSKIVEELRDTFTFLQVDPDFQSDTSKIYNKTGVPRSRFFANLMARPSLAKKLARSMFTPALRMKIRLALTAINTGSKDEVDNQSREYLNKYFNSDILKLEKLLAIQTGWRDE